MAEEQGQGQPTPENEPTPNEQQQPEAKYTDRDLDKHKGNARKEGRNSGRTEREQEILSELGFESLDEVKSVAEAHRLIESESQTEADKAREEADKSIKKLSKERDTVAQERDQAKQELESAYAYIAEMKQTQAMTAAFSEGGVIPQYLSQALRLVEADNLEVDDDGNVTGVEKEVERVKTELPLIFGRNGRVPSSGARDNRQATDGLTGGERLTAYFNQRR